MTEGVTSNELYQQDEPMEELEESDILAKASKGDRDAFGFLYERYVDRIYNYIYYRTGNIHDAEDITARVFYRALHHIHRYTDRGVPFSAWLYRIAHNLVANWHRDRSRKQEISLTEVPTITFKGKAPEQSLMQSEERDNLLRLIRNLTPDRQNLIILKFIDHLSNAEIGQIIGRSEGAVKSLYHRTLLSLRDEIGDQFEDL
ncbi:MAG TPA: sigma-70 family RNA polymerase sigma factor [Anaerolineales bacterium]|nr:sigma-70 family RNA polymerase sigma factor [Anaerolineales bacterium]